MKLSNLSLSELKNRMEKLSHHDRKLAVLVIEHIAEVESRRAFLDWGFSSMYDYLTKGLHYSEGSAYRRLQAARALRKIPEIKMELENGSLNISQLAAAQSSIRKEEKTLRQKVSLELQRQILADISSKNAKQTEQILHEHLPNHETHLSNERHRADKVLLSLEIPKELFQDLEKIKMLFSHVAPGANWVEILQLMAKDVIQKRDPSRKVHSYSTQRFAAAEVPAEPSHLKRRDKQCAHEIQPLRTPISRSVRRAVFQRDRSQCQHPLQNGKICGSLFQIEVDHIQPVSVGGSSSIDNLRLLCDQHNRARQN